VQLVKIANALTNLKRYDEALAKFAEARDRLVRIGEESELQKKVTVHKNLFSVDAIPQVIARIEQEVKRTQEALGRNLLRDGPVCIGAIAAAGLSGESASAPSEWPVLRELDRAIHASMKVLSDLLVLDLAARLITHQSKGPTYIRGHFTPLMRLARPSGVEC
jgi:hypothetical protein